MKLDTKALRYLTPEDWRVLTAVEMGSKNHEIVPTPLIIQLSGLRGGSAVHKSISTLAKANLIARMKNAKYDGYRLTYGGLDYLALHTHLKRSILYSTGNCIGVGKESDIYVCASPTGKQLILKIHRLGRISFRSIKNNRDYLKHRTSASWMYMSRLSALKEFSFMRVLRENGFRVPEPVAHNRHTVVMELVDAFPLRQISSVPDPAGLYAELIEMVMRLAKFGLIHGDFNEFNILIREDFAIQNQKEQNPNSQNNPPSPPPTLTPILIDFPQMLSIDHPNAPTYFDRDINCIKRFFARRFAFVSDEAGPFFSDTKVSPSKRLDVEVEASGFSRKMAKELERYMQAVGADGEGEEGVGDDDEDEDDENEDENEGRSADGDENGSDDLEEGSPTPDTMLGDGNGVDDSSRGNTEARSHKPSQEFGDSNSGMAKLSIDAVG